MRRLWLAAAALALVGAVGWSAAPRPESAEGRADRISSELRCPVCQGLSAKDSPSETAREMRALVGQRVAEGRTDDQIRDEFRAAYGDWVLLSPPVLGLGALVWVVPFALVAAGAAIVAGRIGHAPPAAPQPTDPGRVAALRERVAREEALDS